MGNFSIACKAKDLKDILARTLLEMKKEPLVKVQWLLSYAFRDTVCNPYLHYKMKWRKSKYGFRFFRTIKK